LVSIRKARSSAKSRIAEVNSPSASKTQEQKDVSRDRIVYAAERLFAESGYNNVSVREIATEADVNTALIGYYFSNKEGLLLEIYRRHCDPMIEERMRGLANALKLEGRDQVSAIIEAFVRPALAQIEVKEGKAFFRLRAVLSGENSELLEKIVAQNFDKSSSAFIDALCNALPHLSRPEVCWRFHFLLGAIYYTAAGPHRIFAFSNGTCDPSDGEAVIRALVPFMTQAFYSWPFPAG
jgi:AcrR family transcriptional regulator